MNGVLMPIRWYWPSNTSDPQPCAWAGWVDGEWIEVVLCKE
jgi:hypothetical protein